MARQKSLEEQLQEQALKLKKTDSNLSLGSNGRGAAPPKEKSLAEQLQEQLEKMRKRTEERNLLLEEERKSGVNSALSKQLSGMKVPEEPEDNNQAWNLTR